MARRHDARSRSIGWAGLALVAVLLFVALLVWSGWRSGLMTLRAEDITPRMPQVPALPRAPMPDPQPTPLPRPGPRAEA